MKVLIQRVSSASVEVEGKVVSAINRGFLIFIGIEKGDSTLQADYLAHKTANLRIFEDKNGKMNLSLQDMNAEALVVSQFTLAASLERGNRPGFDQAAVPEEAQKLYAYFTKKLKEENIKTQTGIFQADMKVSLINDGPATFLLEKH